MTSCGVGLRNATFDVAIEALEAACKGTATGSAEGDFEQAAANARSKPGTMSRVHGRFVLGKVICYCIQQLMALMESTLPIEL